MATIAGYLEKQATSRSTLRYFKGVVSLIEINGFKMIGGVAISPVLALLKDVDSAWYAAKIFTSAPKTTDSLKAFCGDISTSKFFKLINNTFMLLACTFATMRFLGTLGVPYLASRVKMLGQLKKGFSSYVAIQGIFDQFSDISEIKKGDKKRGQKLRVCYLSLIGFSCSLFLNAGGALNTIYGSSLTKAGKQGIPVVAWPVVALIAGHAKILKDVLKEFDY